VQHSDAGGLVARLGRPCRSGRHPGVTGRPGQARSGTVLQGGQEVPGFPGVERGERPIGVVLGRHTARGLR
jgi:hypothetical protein